KSFRILEECSAPRTYKNGPDCSGPFAIDAAWDYGVWLVPMYAEAGVQVTPAGQTGTPPFGPMNAPWTVDSGVADEQPLPSHAASKSTEKRPSANIETMTQFWLGRVTPGGKKPGRATEYVPATLLLFRLKYIQPPTSPEVEN